jgi:hypothetical protein
MQHLAGGRPWRWVLESMRAAQEPASVIPNLLLLAPNIVHCSSELPPQEVPLFFIPLLHTSSPHLTLTLPLCIRRLRTT